MHGFYFELTVFESYQRNLGNFMRKHKLEFTLQARLAQLVAQPLVDPQILVQTPPGAN